jgi:hypothetical protein
MERLTRRLNNNKIVAIKGDSCDYNAYSFDCRLSEGIKRLRTALEKLTDYEDLEEQGLLVRLPCKLKNKLYHFYGIDLEDNFVDVIPDEIIMEVVATEFVIDSYEITIKCITGWNSPYEYLPAAEFGKTVFLNREKAVKKLEEMIK